MTGARFFAASPEPQPRALILGSMKNLSCAALLVLAAAVSTSDVLAKGKQAPAKKEADLCVVPPGAQPLGQQPHQQEADPPVRLQVGGGVRSAAVIDDLLRHGVERVVVGSSAVERPEEVAEWLARFGAERICLALDVRMDSGGMPRVRTRGWTEGTALTLWEAVSQFPSETVQHVLCTDIARDGALSGPNLELYRSALSRCPQLAWQASGGVRNAADLRALAGIGVAAAVSGKALLEERITPEELRPFLPDASFPASTSAPARS